MTPFLKISAAGFAATGIAYGPARMGFGLFLTEFRPTFSITDQTAGLLSSLGFAGFLVGLVIAQAATSARGPRLPVVLGLLSATSGLGIVAAAPDLSVLAVGVFLAMSSAGFAWTPFNDAVHRQVAAPARPAALSVVSTGTGLGIVAAGVAALLMSLLGISWRLCWAAFAVASALALLANWLALREVAGPADEADDARWRLLLRFAAIPIFVIGLSFGTCSAIYISFAAEKIQQAGGVAGLPARAAPAIVFICYGAFGLLGLATGSVRAALGLSWLLRLILLACAGSFALLAWSPGTWWAVVLSASLQGIYVMMMSAVLAFWSESLFPALPSRSFTAVLLAVAAGSVLGPAAAGYALSGFGVAATFWGLAGLAAATILVTYPGLIRES